MCTIRNRIAKKIAITSAEFNSIDAAKGSERSSSFFSAYQFFQVYKYSYSILPSCLRDC